MTTTFQAFMKNLSKPIRSFPPGLRETYSEMMKEFRLDDTTRGYEQLNTRDGFNDPSPKGVAHRMYWWFPTHFFKFQESLFIWEERCRESGSPFLLDRPKVTFVDLGCGAGAASAAILSVLEQYQCFQKAGNLLVDPIEVRLVGLDPIAAELTTYEKLVESYAKRIRQHRIFVSYQTVIGEFPCQTAEIAEALSNTQGHTILVGMSNLINWIWKEYDEFLKQDRLAEAANLNPEETKALSQLAEQMEYDYFHVIGIAVKKGRFAFLPRKLNRFFRRLLAALKLAKRPFGTFWGTHAHVVFENPEGSRWVRNGSRGNSHYYVENLLDADPVYIQDSKVHKALSRKSLEAAWAKVRCCMRYESLTDEVELRLFENNLEESLTTLRENILDSCFDRLNFQEHMAYDFPKSPTKTRPRSLPHLEDQLLAAAICVNSAKELEGPCPDVSYSHRLATSKTEFLYRYWFAAYREYLADALRSFNGYQVLLTDIQSYYTNIRQSLLLSIIHERLNGSPRCRRLFTSIVNRDCKARHQRGYGLLQGHALSGLLANVMLQPVDIKLVTESGLNGRYFRFADDMIVTGTKGANSNTETLIQSQLSAHDPSLVLNSNKTDYYAENTFKKRISGYKEFDSLGKRFRALLLPIFLVNAGYRWEFRRADWSFIHRYGEMLERIGIHFSPEWLHRKIDEYGKPHRWIRSIGRRWTISWPSLSLTNSASGKRRWINQFVTNNSNWMAEKEGLKQAFTDMFIRSARELMAGNLSDSDIIRRKRASKFALYRLSVFDVSGACSEIVELLISQPWNIPIGIACRALAKANCARDLRRVVDESTYSYVRAVALRAFGRIRTSETVSLLASVLDSHASQIERLMASEALLNANRWQNIELDTIKDWLQNEGHHPYVQKNIVLIFGQAYPNEARPFLREMDQQWLHSVVHRAIHYVLTKPIAENLLRKSEPEILKKYRAKFYPTIEELLGDKGSYVLISR